MSGADDNFLARWSRRKQAVERAEQSEAPEHPEPAQKLAPPRPRAEGEAAVDAPLKPHPLPSIEDLTADSDLSPFLRAGVSQALKMAALRRAWSLDPAIRDYVGPAEYAYDFNDPATIPGFGSAPAQDAASLTRYVAHSNSTPEPVMRADEPDQPELDPVRQSAPAGAPPGTPEASSASAADPGAPDASAEATGDGPEQVDAGAPYPPPARHGGAIPR